MFYTSDNREGLIKFAPPTPAEVRERLAKLARAQNRRAPRVAGVVQSAPVKAPRIPRVKVEREAPEKVQAAFVRRVYGYGRAGLDQRIEVGKLPDACKPRAPRTAEVSTRAEVIAVERGLIGREVEIEALPDPRNALRKGRALVRGVVERLYRGARGGDVAEIRLPGGTVVVRGVATLLPVV